MPSSTHSQLRIRGSRARIRSIRSDERAVEHHGHGVGVVPQVGELVVGVAVVGVDGHQPELASRRRWPRGTRGSCRGRGPPCPGGRPRPRGATRPRRSARRSTSDQVSVRSPWVRAGASGRVSATVSHTSAKFHWLTSLSPLPAPVTGPVSLVLADRCSPRGADSEPRTTHLRAACRARSPCLVVVVAFGPPVRRARDARTRSAYAERHGLRAAGRGRPPSALHPPVVGRPPHPDGAPVGRARPGGPPLAGPVGPGGRPHTPADRGRRAPPGRGEATGEHHRDRLGRSHPPPRRHRRGRRTATYSRCWPGRRSGASCSASPEPARTWPR